MKKALSLVLAVVLVFGMTVTAFAKGTGGIQVDADYGAIAPVIVKAGESSDVQTLATGQTYSTGTGNLTTKSTSVSGITATGSVTNNVAGIDVTIKVGASVRTGTYNGVVIVLEDKDNKTLTFSVDVTVGSNVVPNDWRIDGINADYFRGTQEFKDVVLVPDVNYPLLTLEADMFTWKDTRGNTKTVGVDNGVVATDGIRDINHNGLRISTGNTKNMSGAVSKVEFTSNGSMIRIVPVKHFIKCSEHTYGYFDLILTGKSGRLVAAAVDFEIGNTKTPVYSEQTNVFTDDNLYIYFEDTVRKIEFEAGSNTYLIVNGAKGQSMYARADDDAQDDSLFAKYPELDTQITMYTLGINAQNTKVYFDLPDTYFVYDVDLKLLGTTADKQLPFSSKYYLTTKKVDMGATAVVDEAPASDEPATPPATTGNEGLGGDEAPVVPNTNYNPNTGL